MGLILGGGRSRSADLDAEQVKPACAARRETVAAPAESVASMWASLPCVTQSVMSSAYIVEWRDGIFSRAFARGSMERLNSRGERTAPWGVPLLGMSKMFDLTVPSRRVAVRSVRKLRM